MTFCPFDMDLKKILEALETISSIDKMPLAELAKKYGELTNQEIEQSIIQKFSLNHFYSGLSNVDFLTSDYLTEHGLKNIYEVDFKKTY